MRRLLFLPVFVIFLSGVFATPAHAIGPAMSPVIAGLGILKALTVLFLFASIPIAFLGMILRSLGFKKEGQGWRWSSKDAFPLFLKYLLYHLGLFGLFYVTVRGLIAPLGFNRYNEPAEPAVFLAFVILALASCSAAWAFIAPTFMYYWRKKRGMQTFRPSLASCIRLTFWNIFIFFGVGFGIFLWLMFFR